MVRFNNHAIVNKNLYQSFSDDLSDSCCSFDWFFIRLSVAQKYRVIVQEVTDCSRIDVGIGTFFFRHLNSVTLQFNLSHESTEWRFVLEANILRLFSSDGL